jgi:EAL domain-containing protein (putative c-di-GMP-specific phosphodiesterase class I)/ActR/RegA family two-component response regulator
MSRPIQVLVAEDEPLVAKALSRMIGLTQGFELVGVAADVDEALEIRSVTPVDVVISDVRMPGGGGLRLVKEFTERWPLTKVLAYSAYSDDRTVGAMLTAGAIGYVVKNGRTAELIDGLRRAAANEPSLTGAAASTMLRKLRKDGAAARPLSPTASPIGVLDAFGSASLTTVFQPIFDLGSHTPVGAEALSRISAPPRRGPDEWFAAADKAGILVEADAAAIRSGLAAARELPSGLFLCCNASPQLALSGALAESIDDFDPARLVLEITERAPIDDYSAFARALAPLRKSGARIAIDDTGSGFASLRHILRLEPDFIKLDRDLCQGINADPARIALASGLASFAFGIGATLIAEGIETQAELDVLTALGVHMGQGYLLGRPEPLSPSWPAVV